MFGYCHRWWLSRSVNLLRLSLNRHIQPAKKIVSHNNSCGSSKGLVYFLSLGSIGGLTLTKGKFPLFSVLCESKPPVSTRLEIKETDEEACVNWSYNDVLLWLKWDWLGCVAAIIGAIAVAVFNVYIPLCLGDFVNKLSECFNQREEISALYFPAFKLCLSYTLQAFITFIYIGLLASVGERVAARLRMQLFERLIYQDVAYFDVRSCGKLLDEIVSDVQTFKSAFKQFISHGLRCSAQVLGSVYALYSISTTLTYTLLGSLPCIFLVGTLMGTELRRRSREARSQNSHAMSIADESLSRIRTVKSLNLEDNQYQRFCLEVDKGRQLNENLGYGVGLFQGLSNLALNGMVLVVLYVGGHLLSRNELNPGELMSFLATTQTVQRSLAQLSLLYGQILRGSVAVSHIYAVLHSSSYIEKDNFFSDKAFLDTKTGTYEQQRLTDSLCVEFENVQFSYPNRPDAKVLDNLNFVVPSGKVVALVGKSGAGKSTVVSLIERFYDPSSGRVLLGGRDLREYSLKQLRSELLAYISQEPQIFNTTVKENIRFGRLNATDEEVEHAARLANAHEFIVNQLPNGYDTRVGQGSDSVAGLSGGQRQRIAIARALLKDAPILLLDEATSALDAESEAQVQASLNTIIKGRTVLVIAHRLSTVRRADLVIVISNGRIVECGTHEDLMSKRGAYYELVRRQENHDMLE